MAKQVQYRRGTTVQHSTFTGALGEITVDTTKNVVVVHDGSTTGGFPMATNAEVVTLAQSLTSNAAVQAAAINALTTNAAVQSSAIDQLNANVTAANAVVNSVANLQNITTHIGPDTNNTRDLGFTDRRWRNLLVANLVSAGSFAFANGTPISFNAITASISSLESNAVAQAQSLATLDANLGTATTNITSLQSNASAQSVEIEDLRANITAANATIAGIVTGSGLVTQVDLQSNLTAINVSISTLDANLGTVTNNITNLQNNAAGQSTEISGLRANITAANVEIDNLRANITAANSSIPDVGNFIFQGNDASLPLDYAMTLSTFEDGGNKESRLTLSTSGISALDAGNNFRISTGYGTGFEKYWGFGADGSITWPDASVQTTAFTTVVITDLRANVTAANLEIGNLRANITAANTAIGNLQANANLQSISSSVSPSANVTYDLGTSDRRWRDLYLSGNTINLGNTAISSNPSNGITVQTVTMGNITFTNTGLEGFGSYAFGNVRLSSDGIVIGSGNDPSTWIYLQTDWYSPNPKPEFYMGGSKIGIDDNGNFVFGSPVAGAVEPVEDVYQIVGIEYKGGGNLALDPNVSISSQVYWTDKLSYRLNTANDLPPELSALGNPWEIYTPYNGNPTNPLAIDGTAFSAGELAFVYTEDVKVYTYTAAQANIALGNIMVTTNIVESPPGTFIISNDPNDWFEVNWAPVFAKGKTAANVNFNTSNVSAWSNIGISNVPGTVTAAIDSLVGAQANISATTQANVTAANVSISNVQANVTAANIEIGSLRSNITAANIEISALRSNVTAANSAIGPVGLALPSGPIDYVVDNTVRYVLADTTAGNVGIYLPSSFTIGRIVDISVYDTTGSTTYGANITANSGVFFGTNGATSIFVSNTALSLIFNGTNWWRKP